MMSDSQKTAIVTGAAQGIGLAIAQKLVNSGMNVLMCDIDHDRLQLAVRTLPQEKAEALTVDMADSMASEQIVSAARQRFGAISVLVNNAGIAPKINGRAANILDITLSEWERVMLVNLTSAMQLCQNSLPDMKKRRWGRVINISSSGGRTKSLAAVGPAYMASKAGLLGLTRHIAGELGAFGITANAVAPGRVATALSATTGQKAEDEYAELSPVGRIGQPDEVAAAVAFLASDEASFINGAVIDVNGGMFML